MKLEVVSKSFTELMRAYKGLGRNNVELYAYYKKSIRIVESYCVQVSEVESRGTFETLTVFRLPEQPYLPASRLISLHALSVSVLSPSPLLEVSSELFPPHRIIARQHDELVSEGSIHVLCILIDTFENQETLGLEGKSP
jgi:hypothetical protein